AGARARASHEERPVLLVAAWNELHPAAQARIPVLDRGGHALRRGQTRIELIRNHAARPEPLAEGDRRARARARSSQERGAAEDDVSFGNELSRQNSIASKPGSHSHGAGALFDYTFLKSLRRRERCAEQSWRAKREHALASA